MFFLFLEIQVIYLQSALKTWGCFICVLDGSNYSSIHFELVSSVLAQGATEPKSELVIQMAIELINNHLNSVQQKR